MVVKQPKFTRVEEPTLLCNQVPIIDSTCPFTADVRVHSWTTIRRRADSERLLLRGLVSSHRKTRHPMTCRI
jgi:hypothetical protein